MIVGNVPYARPESLRRKAAWTLGGRLRAGIITELEQGGLESWTDADFLRRPG